VDRTNRNTALASALIEELVRSGVEHACVSPGSRSAPLALALWKEPGIRVWTHVDERCAGFFAVGLAQQADRPVVVLTTSGTAAANLHPAVAEASEARVPLIVLTADRPPDLRARGAGQTIDQLKLYGSAVRWFCELGTASADDPGLLHFRSTAVRAYAAATGRPPGPVHLNVPLREPLAPEPSPGDITARGPLALDGRAGGAPLTTVPRPILTPKPDVLASLRTAIADTPRGLILAGRQRDPAVAAPVAELARIAAYPVLAEPTSQLRAGEHDLSLVIAPYDAVLRNPPAELTPELVIRVGDMPTSKALRQWLAGNPDCRQIVVDPDGGWNEPTWTAEQMLQVEPGTLAAQLAGMLAPRAESDWRGRWEELSRAADDAIDEFLESLGDELFEPRIHRRLGALLPAGSTVYVASSMPVRDLETFFPAVDRPLRFLSNRGANGIDGLISSGLGAAVATTGRTFVLVGDLGLYHDMNGLLALGRLGIEATIVVFNNGGGAIFDFLPIAEHRDGYEQLFATPTGLDCSAIAALYRLPFTRISSHDELEEAIAGPGLVEVPLDKARNVELHRELFGQVAAACAATFAPKATGRPVR
jgi:2-succinyl-5-enolpyruvyl-6-hydroxy-3-cyclohexene-1-carboxylate synthase